ncbi:unnamed protein product [Mytilus coruscus]|uniref:DZIP3-like HEPN domain-containing protein n=1 Tax=Mytilus coruscus TaxID=42192 RepID=A0A6J8EY26_MYTCO|nr:unnamed protein product [Mytilus coruscus]
MTSMSQLIEEERNFVRFFLLNFKVSPDIVRRFFDGVFPPKNLAQTINSSVSNVIKLYKEKQISSIQFNLLRGVSGKIWPLRLRPLPMGTQATSSKDFDLTLMICLLRNYGGLLTPSNGWDQLPNPNDTLLGAGLATLKWYRNQLAHATVTSMDNNEFTDKWTHVEKVLTSLNKGGKPYEIAEILNYDLDGEHAKSFADAELKQLKKEYTDCEKEREQIDSELAYYKEGNLPKNIEEHKSNILSKEEKKKILIRHLSRRNLENKIKTEEVEIMCETTYAFPLLCKLVSNDEERFRTRIEFFRQPLSVLSDELDQLSHENKNLYCILVLCMLFNGSLSKSIFDIASEKCDKKIYRIMQTCGLQRNMSKKELENGALSAIGLYFTQESNSFRFIHDALEETIGCHFYSFDPRVMFSECDILFIRDRVKVISIENKANIDENIIIIREDDLDEERLGPLYDRLWTEIKNGKFSSSLMSHLFKNRNFVRKFGKTVDSVDNSSMHSALIKASSEQRQSKDQSVFKQALKIVSSDTF